MHFYTFKSFITCLQITVEGFDKLNATTQEQISAAILSRSFFKYKRVNRDKFVFLSQHKELIFGNRVRFNRINKKVCFFQGKDSWSSVQGLAKAWDFTPSVKEALKLWMSFVINRDNTTNIPPNLVRKVKKVIGTQKDAITFGRVKSGSLASKDINGNVPKSKKEDFPEFNVKVNVASLERFIKEADENSIDQVAALYLLATAQTNNGCVPTQYCEYSNARLFALQGISLQNTPKKVRRAAFTGSWQYDIENCHYQILFQKSLQINPDLNLKEMAAYTNNKKSYRENLAKATGLEVVQIKKALLALIFGAKAQSNNDTMIEIAGDKSKVLADAIKPLTNEINACKKVLIADYQSKKGRARGIVNDAGKTLMNNEATANQTLAFLLQGTESEMLRIIMSCYKQKLQLLIHDGVISSERLDPSTAEQAIFDKLGISVTLDEEYIGDMEIERQIAA